MHRVGMQPYFKQLVHGPALDPRAKYKCEAVRFGSFSGWPPECKTRPVSLARIGFYWTHRGDELKCFSCEASVRDWVNTDGLEEAHRQVHNNCPMLMGTDSDNIPLLPPAMNKREADEGLPVIPIPTEGILADILTSHVPRRQPGNQVDLAFVEHHYLEGLLGNKKARFLNGFTIGETVSSLETMGRTKVMDRKHTSSIQGTLYEEATGQMLMKREEERMKTFSSWPARERVDPVELAKAGFYYFGVSDRVRCAFCHNVLQKWVTGDIPLEEHTKFFPNCRFVQGLSTGIIVPEEVEAQNATKTNVVDGTMGKKTGKQMNMKYKGKNSDKNLRNGHEQRCLEVPVQPPQQQQGLPEPEEVLAGAPQVHSLHIQDHARGVALTSGAENARGIDDEEEHSGHSPGENPSGAAVDSRGRYVDQVQDNHRQLQHQQQQQQQPRQREGWQQQPQQEQRRRSLRRRQQQRRQQQQLLWQQQRQRRRLQLILSPCGILEQVVSVEGRAELLFECLSSNGIQAEDELLCRVCSDREACMIFLPCGHRSCCWQCSQQMPHTCPVCSSWAHSRLRGKRDMDDPAKYMRYPW